LACKDIVHARIDGTIDTTRTLFLGAEPPPAVKRAYTRVLQGHLAVSIAIFPEGMSADWMNMLARQPLYKYVLGWSMLPPNFEAENG
jgi:Xaa-Pro aminopeptidase